MRKIQDEAMQVLLDNVSRSYDSKTDLIKSSFKAWGMKITAHIQILEKLTLTQLVSLKLLITKCTYMVLI